MAMGIPIVCNTGVGDTDKIVLDYSSGVLVNSFTTEDYAIAIEKLNTTAFEEHQIIQ